MISFNKYIFILLFLFVSSESFSQEKKYKIACIGFYNLENLFDTINEPNNDEEFLPDGAYHYTSEVYLDKLSHLSDVISQIATYLTPDGLALMGCAEVENRSVLEDLLKQPKISSRHYEIVHYDSPDERGIDVGLI